ncbi:hypothetical protein [Amycolatopsis dendrobii]|uniref:Uncharacterized protein n=1 Tax=Amycolatopsis dendrobii TaxID=2760662 RepID=A0A7W3ZE22_9PSEU|nr:hypothetical protein [Amycolatopsis dendrobii]MBB1158141.1 hypothetical protein [Amycolatopsis dendrobii]
MMHVATPGRLPLTLNRKFHLSNYVSSHAQVLLRSGRSGYHDGEYLKYDSMVDVLFKNVSALAVVDSYYPLVISEAEPSDFERFSALLNVELGNRKLYVLRGSDSMGYIVAGALYWADDPEGSASEESVLLGYQRARAVEVFEARS